MSQHNEAKQHSQNYIEQVCEQVRWKKAHPIVQEELLAHIEDQAEAYREEGYEADDAEYLAVEQMGDPILAGSQFDKVYRPRVEWNVLLLAGSIILLGTVLRLTLQIASGVPVDWGTEIIKIFAALPFLVLGYSLDYTALLSGKTSKIFVFIVVILTILLKDIVQIAGNNLVNYTIPLWVLLFIMTVYAMRGKETTGFLLAFAEIIAMLLIFAVLYKTTIPGILVWLGSTFIITLYALKKNWFRCSKKLGFLFAVCPIILSGFVIGHPHRIDRIKYMLNPGVDSFGYGYVPSQISEIMKNASFLGSGGVNLAYLTEHLPNMHTDYILTTALSYWGWLSILVILLSYGIFFTLCFMACKKVKSQMGRFVIVAITSCWVLQFVSYLIINFTTLQMSTYPLLFVQGGYMRMINLFLLGIVMSVYKTGAVQKDAEPKTKTSVDSFYSERNLAQIRKSDQQIKEGRVIVKTMDELEALE